MMPEWPIVAVVFAVGAASYAMRAGGFLAASALPQSGPLPRLLRLAPGNLLVSFAAAGIFEGGWPSLAGCLGAVATMAVTKREWAALGAGFGATALISAVL
jgi:hypothetical protein